MILKKIAFTLILGSLFLWVSLELNILSHLQPEISKEEIGKLIVLMVTSSLKIVIILYLQVSFCYRPWQGSWWGKYLDKHHIVNQMTSYLFSIFLFLLILGLSLALRPSENFQTEVKIKQKIEQQVNDKNTPF